MTKDEEIVLFHYVLGVAIAQWSYVEDRICAIMVNGFENKSLNRESLAVGFGSLQTFNSKITLADNIISRKLATMPQEHEEWKPLADKARVLSSSRNKLAHWRIGKYWQRKPGLRVVLVPGVYKKSKKKTRIPLPPEGSLTIREIYKCNMAFIALAYALNNFLHRLHKQPEPHAKSAEQPNNPPTADTLMRQIREVVSTLPQSSGKKS